MEFLARFRMVDGHLFRFDTRIYLGTYSQDSDSKCVGAIIGKNPGSAAPLELDRLLPLALNGDKMLPTVGNRFLDGYRLAKRRVPENAYIRVWNLFYVCEKDLGRALEIAKEFNTLPECPTEQESAPITWFGWGGPDVTLGSFKDRFLRRQFRHAFHYDHRLGRVLDETPSNLAFAKHTQGMPAAPVATHLAKTLSEMSES